MSRMSELYRELEESGELPNQLNDQKDYEEHLYLVHEELIADAAIFLAEEAYNENT